VSAATCGEPLSLARIPADRIMRLAGLTDEQLAVSLDPLPDGAPVVIRYRLPGVSPSPSALVDDALDRLQSMAIDLFPAWLPEAGVLDASSDLDRRVVRQLAHRRAADSKHFGPYLADLADVALSGCAADRRFGPQMRACGLARVIGESYGRVGVVLLIGPGPDGDACQRGAATACEWLVAHGGIGVWLTAGAMSAIDRYPTWQLSVPEFVDTLASGEPIEAAPVDYPALLGRPHPASAAEQMLERCLAQYDWATGRIWNQEYASHSLAPPIRVDLVWPAERCVVEIDGPDHRGSLKYAADRRRDNGLILDGFAVLRFTNDEVRDDPARVLDVIARLLSTKRHETTKRHDEGNLA
jgi:very-short-patch-repair endonuclease